MPRTQDRKETTKVAQKKTTKSVMQRTVTTKERLGSKSPATVSKKRQYTSSNEATQEK